MRTAFLLLLVALTLFFVCGRNAHWEVELHDRDTTLALTFRDSSGSLRQTVVLDGVTVGVLKPRSYRLPEDVPQLEGARLEFSDITVKPGRVRLLLHGHSFDIMQRALIIDGRERSWTAPDELHLKVTSASKINDAGLARVDLDDVEIAAPAAESELLDVHDALDAFAAHYPQRAQLVKLRYLPGSRSLRPPR